MLGSDGQRAKITPASDRIRDPLAVNDTRWRDPAGARLDEWWQEPSSSIYRQTYRVGEIRPGIDRGNRAFKVAG